MTVNPTQDSGFTGGQAGLLFVPGRRQTAQIHYTAVRGYDLGLRRGRGRTATEGVDPGEQFADRKRFGQVVVGACLETRDLFVL